MERLSHLGWTGDPAPVTARAMFEAAQVEALGRKSLAIRADVTKKADVVGQIICVDGGSTMQ